MKKLRIGLMEMLLNEYGEMLPNRKTEVNVNE